MRHTIGSFTFDIIAYEERHVTDNGREYVDRRFTVGLYDSRGRPMPWHPHDKHTGEPHVQTVRFFGRVEVDVYEEKDGERVKVGTKPGGDWRTRLWPCLVDLAEQARVSALKRRSIYTLSPAELERPLVVEPVNLRARSIEDAAKELTRQESVRGSR